MTTEPIDGSYPRLAFVVDEVRVAGFFLLLQQGVKIRRRVGCSVGIFLLQEIGASPETIETIQSIILDGKPVDDIGSALVHDSSVLALSAAMPGLVGATLRRGGAYSSFRSVITYHETGMACAPGEGWVRVKIFNLLMAALGPDLLQKGVLVSAAHLLGLLMERAEEFGQLCSAVLDGTSVDIDMLGKSTLLEGKEQVFLTVEVGPGNPHYRA
jgi:hypothetical protein